MENHWFCCIALSELGTPPEKSYGHEFIKMKKKTWKVVAAYAGLLDQREVKQADRNVRALARACLARKGTAFEANL